VFFTPPAYDGGSPVTSYTVTASPGGASSTGNSTQLGVSGLRPGTAYTFTVTANNAAGSSLPSAPSVPSTATDRPGPPTRRSAVGGNGQATIYFTPPASNGGSPITSYTVDANTGANVTGTSSPIVMTGLTNGTQYTFSVSATNEAGTGQAS